MEKFISSIREPKNTIKFICYVRYICLAFVIAFGFTAIVACAEGDVGGLSSIKNNSYVALTENNSPVAVIEREADVSAGDNVILDGSLSQDPDDDTLTYSWNIISLPENSKAQLSSLSNMTTALAPDYNGTYIISLIVNDGLINSDVVTVSITISDKYRTDYYIKKCNGFTSENLTATKGQIVFVGDSITETYHVESFYPSWKIYNRGISSDVTEGLLARMDCSIFDLEPSIIVFLMGINDLSWYGTSAEQLYANYNAIFSEIETKLPNTHVIIESIYPINDDSSALFVEASESDIISANNQLSNLAARYGYTYVDVFSRIVVEGSSFLDERYSDDGVHPSPEGYACITEVLTPVIQSLLEK